MDIPPIRFAQARGARLAYQQFGSGPDVVAVPPMAQNIEVAWEWPRIREMLERLGTFCRFLHFDKRGTGASDRRAVGGLDERVDDLQAVMDDAGVERAHLYGASEGAPMTLMFAATYPDRVASVTLMGGGASEYPADMTPEERESQEALHRRFATVWGTPDSPLVRGFAPSLAHDEEFVRWHQRYERLSATPESLMDLLDLTFEMDVRDVLGEVRAPTLVIHRTGDPIVPIARGREVADGVPDGRIYEQEGVDHFAYAGDVEGWMQVFRRFIDEVEASGNGTSGSSAGAIPRSTNHVGSSGAHASDGTVTPADDQEEGGSSEASASRTRPRVRVTTLGRFAVEVDGGEVEVSAWGTRRSRTLLKRLVVARGWPVRRDELFELLWPDELDRSKLGPRLSVQLSTVRRVLGGGVIADRESVRLDLDVVATDLEDLHRAPSDASVIAVYAGELLPDDDADWVAPVRAEARTRFLAAAGRELTELARGRAWARAVALARRVLAEDPYDATAHRALTVALGASGHVGEAAVAHRAWTEAMAELGLAAPSLESLQRG